MISPDANLRHTAIRATVDMAIPRAPSTSEASLAATVFLLNREACLPGFAGGRPGPAPASFLWAALSLFPICAGKNKKRSGLMPSEVIDEWRKSVRVRTLAWG